MATRGLFLINNNEIYKDCVYVGQNDIFVEAQHDGCLAGGFFTYLTPTNKK